MPDLPLFAIPAGAQLARPVYGAGGVLILAAGAVLDDPQRGMLRARGIRCLPVTDPTAAPDLPTTDSAAIVAAAARRFAPARPLTPFTRALHNASLDLLLARAERGRAVWPPPPPARDIPPAPGTTSPLRQRVAELPAIPTLPTVRTHLREAILDDRSSLRGVAGMIMADPALCAQALRLLYARHPRFAGHLPVPSKAMAALGFATIREIADAPILTLPGSDAAAHLRGLWGHALATALAAEMVAEAAGNVDPHAAYLAGLLHDIGKIALYHMEPERFDALAAQAYLQGQTFYAVEASGGSHAVLGRTLAEAWGFPLALVEAIGWHHTPQLSVAHAPLVAATHLGDIMARALLLGWGGDTRLPVPHADAAVTLGLRAGQVSALLRRLDAAFPRAAATLGLAAEDLYGPPDDGGVR